MSSINETIFHVNFENAGKEYLDAGVATLGQVFARGELAANSGLTAVINGVRHAVQVDVKTTYEDGSAKMAVLSVDRPGIAAGATVDAAMTIAAAPTAPAIDLSSALNGHSFLVDLSANGGTTRIDVLDALRHALADGTATSWQSGALAAQSRVEVDLPGSQRMVFDVTAYKGGGFAVEAQFNNDGAMQATGGRVAYDVVVTMDGQVAAHETVNQGQYQNWHRSFDAAHDGGQGLGSADSGWLNIRQDIAHLQATGAVAHYDLANGIAESLLNRYGDAAASPTWDDPLSSRGVTEYMPMTGGREDIGISTAANTTWLISQDIRAASYALGQAEAASGVPWNMYDQANGKWLSVEDYPHLWIDGRGGTGTPGDANSGGLTQQIDSESGWTAESSHQPDLSYVPYLMTGQRWILDNLQAQGAWNVVTPWSDTRGSAGNIVVDGHQVRHSAWALRQIDEAAWASPDGSAEKAYFTEVSKANWAWLVEHIPAWTAAQGEAYGRVQGDYGTVGAAPPWQQDYFASTAIAAATRGNADALTFLEWQSNFLIGRFTHQADGFDLHDGVAYLLAVSDPATGRPYGTWAEIAAQTEAVGWSNNDGWAHSQGDYAQLALATLAGIAHLTGSAAAAAAYQALLAEAPPYTTSGDFSRNPTFAIAAPGEIDTTPHLPPVAQIPAIDPPHVEHPPVQLPSELPVPVTDPVLHAPAEGKVALAVVLGADSWKGDPEAIVRVDGVVAFHGNVSASHESGGAAIALGNYAAGVAHTVSVEFTNDAVDVGPNSDRNLYVEDLLVNGHSTGHSEALMWERVVDFSVPAGEPAPAPTQEVPVVTAPPASTVALAVVLGADSWKGDPEAIVRVDGVVAFHGNVSASHESGGAAIALGNYAAGVAHTVSVEFTNDAVDVGPNSDRNLYVEDLLVNGHSTGHSEALMWERVVDFSVPAGEPAPVPVQEVPVVTAPPASTVALAVVLGADSWKGDPEAIVRVDGVVAFHGNVSASHESGGAAIALGNYAAGVAHTVSVEFTNDAVDVGPNSDRNLYVEDLLVNGHSTGHSEALMWERVVDFSVPAGEPAPAPTSPVVTLPAPVEVDPVDHQVPSLPAPVASTVSLAVVLGAQSWMGDPEAVVRVDGIEAFRGAVTASHESGGAAIALGDYAAGTEHTVTVEFLNDAVGVGPGADRNLIVEDILVGGHSTGQSAALMWEREEAFTVTSVTGPASGMPELHDQVLRIGLSQDAWNGDALFNVSVDGQVILANQSVTASHAAQQTSYLDLKLALADGDHTLAITFLNDAWGETPEQDRNLHVDSVMVNGVDLHQSTSLMSWGDAVFAF